MSPRMPTSPRSSPNVASRESPTQSRCASFPQSASRRRRRPRQPKYKERPVGRSSRIESLLLLRLRLLPGVGRIQLLLILLLLLLHILQFQQQLLRSLRAVRLVAIVRCWLGVRVRRRHRNLPGPESPRHGRNRLSFRRVVGLRFGGRHFFVQRLLGSRLWLNLPGTVVLRRVHGGRVLPRRQNYFLHTARIAGHPQNDCLLYTSDAADEEDSVD